MSDRIAGARGERRVLIVEDEALIGLDMARTLERSGYKVVGPFADEDEAMDGLAATPPDAALLDVHLGNGRDSFGVATLLKERNVPFVFLTGYSGSSTDLSERFPGVPRLPKPCPPGELERQLGSFFGV